MPAYDRYETDSCVVTESGPFVMFADKENYDQWIRCDWDHLREIER